MKYFYRFNRRGIYAKIRKASWSEMRRDGDEIYARRMKGLRQFPELYSSVLAAENEVRHLICGC